MKQFIKKNTPDLIGISAVTDSMQRASEISYIAKDTCKTKIIIGGPHASALPRETLIQYPLFDFACIAEGEITMTELADNISQGNYRFHQINGLAFRNGNTIVVTPSRNFIEDLDNLPYPDRDLLNISLYGCLSSIFNAGRSATMMTSRGCPFQCSFCASKYAMGSKFRACSPQRVIEEIKYLKNNYGIQYITFLDDAFTLNKNRTKTICNMLIQEKLDINWTCASRVDHVNEDLLFLMKQAGCKIVFFGIESANCDILKNIRKGATVEQARKAIALANKLNLKVIASFMIGNPGETKETIIESINFAVETDPFSATFGIFVPLPGTEIFAKFIRKNLDKDLNWNSFTFKNINSMKEYVELSPNELRKYIFLAYIKFYLRPRIICRFLKSTLSWKLFFKKILNIFWQAIS